MRRFIMIVLFTSLISRICFSKDNILAIGDTAPDFSLKTATDSTIVLSSFKGNKYVVLVFYPGDETPVCTKQLCELRDEYQILTQRDAVVFGINPGSKQSHKKFSKKHRFNFPLLVDLNSTVADRYHAKGVLMNKRTVYVVDKQSLIVFAKRRKPPVADILAVLPQQ